MYIQYVRKIQGHMHDAWASLSTLIAFPREIGILLQIMRGFLPIFPIMFDYLGIFMKTHKTQKNTEEIPEVFRKYSGSILEAFWHFYENTKKTGSNSGSIPEVFRKQSGSILAFC